MLINGDSSTNAAEFNSSTVTLLFDAMPPASELALQSVNSSVLTASTQVNVTIVFAASEGNDVTERENVVKDRAFYQYPRLV